MRWQQQQQQQQCDIGYYCMSNYGPHLTLRSIDHTVVKHRLNCEGSGMFTTFCCREQFQCYKCPLHHVAPLMPLNNRTQSVQYLFTSQPIINFDHNLGYNFHQDTLDDVDVDTTHIRARYCPESIPDDTITPDMSRSPGTHRWLRIDTRGSMERLHRSQ